MGLAGGYHNIRERPNMPGHKSNNALPSAREKLLDEVSNDAVPAWPLDADSPIRLGQTPEQEKHVQIRLILIILVWMSVTGMWISFPVVDLKESKSPLGPALLVGSSEHSQEAGAGY